MLDDANSVTDVALTATEVALLIELNSAAVLCWVSAVLEAVSYTHLTLPTSQYV